MKGEAIINCVEQGVDSPFPFIETVWRRQPDGKMKMLGMSVVDRPTPMEHWEEIAQRYEQHHAP